MANFAFLPAPFRDIAASATRAESQIMADPRAACFHARFTLEAVAHWIYRHDPALRMPYDRGLGALLYEPTFQNLLPQAVFQKARVIQKRGNQAARSWVARQEGQSPPQFQRRQTCTVSWTTSF